MGPPESEARGVRLSSRWTLQMSLPSPGASPEAGQKLDVVWGAVTGTPEACAAQRTLRVGDIYCLHPISRVGGV